MVSTSSYLSLGEVGLQELQAAADGPTRWASRDVVSHAPWRASVEERSTRMSWTERFAMYPSAQAEPKVLEGFARWARVVSKGWLSAYRYRRGLFLRA